MLTVKPISREAIPVALTKAERYRLLNEPAEAESICEDVLEIDPDNQPALVMLLLALTDQFDRRTAVQEARDVLARLHDDYERSYYAGIICERWGKALMDHATLGAGVIAYDWFRQAMTWYEKAEVLRPAGNDDAILRWNTCARFLMRHPELQPGPEERGEPIMSE